MQEWFSQEFSGKGGEEEENVTGGDYDPNVLYSCMKMINQMLKNK